MRKHPRRTLLGGIGSTIAIAAAGCLSASDDTDDTDDSPSENSDEDDLDGFDALLEAVPGSINDSVTLSAVDFERVETANIPDDGIVYGIGLEALDAINGDPDAISKGIGVDTVEENRELLSVFELTDDDPDSLDLDVTFESDEHSDDSSHERAQLDGDTVAVVDDIAIVGDSAAIVDDALEAYADEADTLLDERPALENGLEYGSDADSRGATADGDVSDEFGFEPDTVEYVAYAMTVVDSDTLEYTYAFALESESEITDDLLAIVDDQMALFSPQHGTGVSVEPDGNVVTANWTVDLEAQRYASDHDSPSGLRLEDVDLDSEYVDATITHADPTPVDELTIEVDDEPYDETIWADEQTEIEEDDTIRLETDVLEPNLSVTVTHETEKFSTSYTTQLLNNFWFDFDHDLDAETMTVQYADDYPLDGDQVIVAVHDLDYEFGDTAEPLQTATPWEGMELSAGDEMTLEDVEPGMTVIVGWNGSTYDEAIANTMVQPPGNTAIDYEYETEHLTVELRFQDGRAEPADAYEIQLDDEPAATQWSDETDHVEDGSTVILENVDVGTIVTVTWNDEVTVSNRTATPSVRASTTLEDGDLVLVYEDGPSLPVSELEADVFTDGGTETIALDSVTDDSFSEGDTVVLMEDIDPSAGSYTVALSYDGDRIGSAFSDW